MVSLKILKKFNGRTVCVFKENYETGFFYDEATLFGYLCNSLEKFGSIRLQYTCGNKI